MCRMYGQISPASIGAQDYLMDAERSLLAQGNAQPRNKQKSGWGVGYFIGKKARVVKSVLPVSEEKSLFTDLASRIRSHVIIGHLRTASNPGRRNPKRFINETKNQPFTDGHFLFAHNGAILIPEEVAAALGPLKRRIRGGSDSEIYFWQFIKHYKALGNIPDALEACVREIWTIWKTCRRRHLSRQRPYTELNTLVSDGRSLHALCHYDPSDKRLKSLFDQDKPWGQMSLGRRGGRLVLASEDMDTHGWTRLSDGEIVSAALREGHIEVRRRRFKPGG